MYYIRRAYPATRLYHQLDLQKFVFSEKIGSVQEKLNSLLKLKQNEKSTFIYEETFCFDILEESVRLKR